MARCRPCWTPCTPSTPGPTRRLRPGPRAAGTRSPPASTGTPCPARYPRASRWPHSGPYRRLLTQGDSRPAHPLRACDPQRDRRPFEGSATCSIRRTPASESRVRPENLPNRPSVCLRICFGGGQGPRAPDPHTGGGGRKRGSLGWGLLFKSVSRVTPKRVQACSGEYEVQCTSMPDSGSPRRMQENPATEDLRI